MKNTDYNLFPTLVRKIEDFISDKEIKSIIDNSKKMKFSEHGAILGDSTSSHALGLVTKNSSHQLITNTKLRDRLDLAIDEFRKEYGMAKLQIDNAWVNIQGLGSQLKFHTHPDSIISGAIYLNVDEQSSPLYFYNPNPYSEYLGYFYKPETLNYLNFKTIYLKPKNGDLILFPSWFRHGSEHINQTKERIVMSFNTCYKKNL